MDTPAIRSLRQKFTETMNEAQSLNTKADATPEEIKRAGELVEEAEGLQTQIKAAIESGKKLEALKEWDTKPVNLLPQPGMKQVGETRIEVEGAGTSTKSVLHQIGAGVLTDSQIKAVLSDDYNTAFKQWLRGKGDMNRVGRDERKMLEAGLDDEGGVLAPAEMLMRLIERKATPTRVAAHVTSLTTGRDAVVLPKQTYDADDIYTSGVRVTWTGEHGNPPKAETPQFGTFRVPVYEAMLEINLTNTMIEDAAMDITGYASDKARETVDILEDDMVLRGTGINQPRGILSGIDTAGRVQSVKSGNASLLTADGLIDLAYAIPEQYMENSRWVYNRTNTEKAIAKLKDDQKRYLFYGADDSHATARPTSLLGFEPVRSALMPNIEANAYPILFGDLRGYYLVRRLGFSLRVLTEIEARANQTVLLGRLRIGGDLAEAWRLRAQKVAS